MSDLIIDGNKLMMGLADWWYSSFGQKETEEAIAIRKVMDQVEKSLENYKLNLPSAQPDKSKYEYHYDHTDCIWYRPEARNRCPSTCAQYRDGWNDAMQYIFRDGKGYRPYRRDKPYER